MLNSPLVRRLIHLAIEEDLSFDDVTSSLSIPQAAQARAEVMAKQALVVCGTPLIPLIFDELGAEVENSCLVPEGELVEPQTVLAKIEGRTRDLLSAERMILNFLQRLSGVATLTRRFVEQAGSLVVLDTRKTLPGWRLLDKYAVGVGGAKNHRFHLGDMILVKNNHIDVAPGKTPLEKVRATLATVFEKKPTWMPVEVEVRDLSELKAVLDFKPQIVMLDNMPDEGIREALKLIKSAAPDVQVEISGKVTVDRLASLRALGVNCVSVGALTTQATNVDISMSISGIA